MSAVIWTGATIIWWLVTLMATFSGYPVVLKFGAWTIFALAFNEMNSIMGGLKGTHRWTRRR